MAEAKNTGNGQDTRIVRIWDDPESRINFLETMLKDKEWEAVVYHPGFSPDGSMKQGTAGTPLPELARHLQAKGYKTALGQDENGIPTLSVRNFGNDTTIATAVKELGFVKGMTHKVTHSGEHLGNAIGKVGELMKFALTDKARLIGTAYLVGDLFLAFAGGSGHSKDKLKGIAGVAATVQSLVFMGFAKEGDEAMLGELNQAAKRAGQQGKDLLDKDAWKQQDKGFSLNPVTMGHNLLKKYPMQIGALTQVAGQAAFFAAGARNLAKGGNKVGAITDMLTATSSAVGWSLVTRQSKEIPEEDKLPWSNPKRAWQEMQAHPNKFASGLLAAATVTGITGGIFDRDPSQPRLKGGTLKEKALDLYQHSNKPQVLAYSTYLIGDGIMFATESGHYGAAGMNNADMLSDAAEEFVKQSPMLLGEKEQGQFVANLSDYLAERASNEVAKKEKREVAPGEVEALSERINRNLIAKLPPVNPRTNEVAGKIAAIVNEFHPQLAGSISDGICAAVCETTGVSIGKEELKAHVQRQIEPQREPKAEMVTVAKLEKPLAALVHSLPGAANAQSIDKLFSAVDEFVRPEPVAKTAQPAAGQPVVGQHTAALASARQHPQEKSAGI